MKKLFTFNFIDFQTNFVFTLSSLLFILEKITTRQFVEVFLVYTEAVDALFQVADGLTGGR